MLIAGTTGSGKSVCLNSLLLSLLDVYKRQIRQAVQFARAGVIEEIEKNIDYMRLPAGAVKTEE